MALFSKPSDLPTDQVKAMRARGFDNNQIVQALQRNSYSSSQIFDALNQADLVSGAPGMMDNSYQQQAPQQDQMQQQQAPQPQDYQPVGAGVSTEEVEQLVESIIEEKWSDLSKDINKIVEWKNEIEARLMKLDQKFESLKDDFDKLHQAIIGKIGDYDKNILTVGAEIQAMEKVFSKVLPVFTENVNELSRVTQVLTKRKND
ncbi:MAG: hypothetical protein V1866_03700 [archaeon]